MLSSRNIKNSLTVLSRAQNLLQRSKDANNLRDKISRGYYACYHACVAAVLLKGSFDYNSPTGSPHRAVRERYRSLYSTKAGQIVKIGDYNKTMVSWKTLRESADYEIYTKDFEILGENRTYEVLDDMYDFVDKHLVYIQNLIPESSKHLFDYELKFLQE